MQVLLLMNLVGAYQMPQDNSQHESLRDVLAHAKELYRANKMTEAEAFFERHKSSYFDEMLFQADYLEFLLKVGKYEKIIEMEKKILPEVQDLVANAKLCRRKVMTRDPKQISQLFAKSPNSYTVVYMSALSSLYERDGTKFQKFFGQLNFMEIPKNKTNEVIELEAVYNAWRGNYDRAIHSFRQAGVHNVADKLSRFQKQAKEIQHTAETVDHKIERYKSLCRDMRNSRIMDIYQPSVYENLYNTVIKALLMLAVNHSKIGFSSDASSFYSDSGKSKYSAILFIRTLLLDGSMKEAEKLMNEHRRVFSKTELNYMDSQVNEAKRKMKEKKQREEQERQERKQREEYYRRERQQPKPPVNRDQDHYKVIGVPKTATVKEIKKAYRKKLKELNKKNKKAGKSATDLDKNIEKEMQKLNKAYEILTNEESRKEYDMGPQHQYYGGNNGRQGGQYQQYVYDGRSGENFGFGGDFGNIFDEFLGGAFGGGGRSSQRFYYSYF